MVNDSFLTYIIFILKCQDCFVPRNDGVVRLVIARRYDEAIL